MSELYERLKARIDDSDSLSPFHGATRAVLELHKPQTVAYDPHDNAHLTAVECHACESEYPCSTVRAIARALGIEIGDHQ